MSTPLKVVKGNIVNNPNYTRLGTGNIEFDSNRHEILLDGVAYSNTVNHLTQLETSMPIEDGDSVGLALSKLNKIIEDNELVTAAALVSLNEGYYLGKLTHIGSGEYELSGNKILDVLNKCGREVFTGNSYFLLDDSDSEMSVLVPMRCWSYVSIEYNSEPFEIFIFEVKNTMYGFVLNDGEIVTFGGYKGHMSASGFVDNGNLPNDVIAGLLMLCQGMHYVDADTGVLYWFDGRQWCDALGNEKDDTRRYTYVNESNN